MRWKGLVNSGLRRLGYEIHKHGDPTIYTPRPPYPHATYSPWFDEWFEPVYARIRGHTLVSEDRCYVLHQLGGQCSHLDGDYAEAGVYRGGTALLLVGLISKHPGGRRLHLFDTFSGMPAEADEDASGHREGDFSDTSVDAVRRVLADFPSVEFHAGLIPQTFASVAERRFAFVHVDVDLFQAGLDCCEFFYPRLARGGFMVFDDYGFPKYERAMRAAVDRFFADKREAVLVLATGQSIVCKL